MDPSSWAEQTIDQKALKYSHHPVDIPTGLVVDGDA
jgi:hypothetical protein